MATIRDSIDVKVPASVAYQQWSHYENFPSFMEGIEEVRRVDERHMHWRAKVGGKRMEWDSEVTDMVPGRRIAWRSTSGARNDGIVEFEAISPDSTRVQVQMDYEPRGMMEKVGDALGLDERRVHKDLEHFREYAERQYGRA